VQLEHKCQMVAPADTMARKKLNIRSQCHTHAHDGNVQPTKSLTSIQSVKYYYPQNQPTASILSQYNSAYIFTKSIFILSSLFLPSKQSQTVYRPKLHTFLFSSSDFYTQQVVMFLNHNDTNNFRFYINLLYSLNCS
jgi:hypothetical protein